jgi:hypothetical protein
MSWCLSDILNIHGDVGLNGGNGLWGPAKGPVIYPDLQPSAIIDNSEGIPIETLPTQSIIEGASGTGIPNAQPAPDVGAINNRYPAPNGPTIQPVSYSSAQPNNATGVRR